uniref:Epsilon-adaptin, putative n=1 Tax=Arundo donax TaxID=35708 RepID=A0A0A9E982_ARUDO
MMAFFLTASLGCASSSTTWGSTAGMASSPMSLHAAVSAAQTTR